MRRLRVPVVGHGVHTRSQIQHKIALIYLKRLSKIYWWSELATRLANKMRTSLRYLITYHYDLIYL